MVCLIGELELWGFLKCCLVLGSAVLECTLVPFHTSA